MDCYRTVLLLVEWYDGLPLLEAYKLAGLHESPPALTTKEEIVDYLSARITMGDRSMPLGV